MFYALCRLSLVMCERVPLAGILNVILTTLRSKTEATAAGAPALPACTEVYAASLCVSAGGTQLQLLALRLLQVREASLNV